MQMIDLSQLLPRLLTASSGNDELLEAVVQIAWTQVAGPGIRQQVAPFRLHRKTLIVAVTDAIWQKQLHHMSGEFITRINRLLGAGVVGAIEFRIDPATVKQQRIKTSVAERSALPAEVPADIINASNTIKDSELRQRFIRAAANCVTRRDAIAATRMIS
jgi:hypothetical protein